MTLAAQLDKIRETAGKRLPPDKFAIMNAATENLRTSGILDGVPKVGETLPSFSLKDAQGEEVRSSDILSRGPLVLSVFRGVW